MRRAATLAAALLAAALAAPAQAGNRALVIGVSDYPHAPASARLPGAAADAVRMRDFVTEIGWFARGEVVEIYNDAATADGIARAIARLAAETAPGDRVLIYYSGHGTRVPDSDGDEPDGFDEALVASDAGIDPALAPGRPQPGILLDDEMDRLLGTLAGRDVTVILDSCHSGTATRGADDAADGVAVRALDLRLLAARPAPAAVPPTATPAAVPPTLSPPPTVPPAEPPPTARAAETPYVARATLRTVWSAAAPAQASWEDRRGGVFTQAFIGGLRTRRADANANGVITSAELLDHARAITEAWCKRATKCAQTRAGFTPHFEGAADDALLTYAAPATAGRPPTAAAPAGAAPTRPATGGTPPAASATAGTPPNPPAAAAPTAPQPAVASDLLGSGNDANLALALIDEADRPSPANRIGARMRIRVATDRPGQLIVLDIDPLGRLTQVSPSRLSRPGVERIAQAGTVTIPDQPPGDSPWARRELTVTDPAGRGQLVALLIEHPDIAIDTVLGRNLTLAPIEGAAAHLAALADRLRALRVEGGSNRALAWSVAYLDYDILP